MESDKEFQEGFIKFRDEWEQKKTEELKKMGIERINGRKYKNNKEVWILDDRDPLLEYMDFLAKSQNENHLTKV